MDSDTKRLQKWAAENWEEGCLQGDLAREEDLSDDEALMLTCLYEGWLKAGGAPMES